jgi:hypothetical protein
MQNGIMFAMPEWLCLQYGNLPHKPISELVLDIIVILIDMTTRTPSHDEISTVQFRFQNLLHVYENDARFQGLPIFSYGSSDRTYPDELTALTILYFSCASVLFSSASTSTINASTEASELLESCNSIISCAKYLETKAIGCGYMRMMFPLVLVALKGPLISQQEHALNVLHTWKTANIMSGLCIMALDAIEKQAKANSGRVTSSLDSKLRDISTGAYASSEQEGTRIRF